MDQGESKPQPGEADETDCVQSSSLSQATVLSDEPASLSRKRSLSAITGPDASLPSTAQRDTKRLRPELSSKTNIPVPSNVSNDNKEACVPAQAAAGVKTKKVRKKRKKVFEYGNYDRYYGYRVNGGRNQRCTNPREEIWNDPRLKLFTDSMFRGKRCLDIGCNAGYLTMSIAQKHGPQHILGIDIDSSLIAKARRVKRWRATVVRRRMMQNGQTQAQSAAGCDVQRSVQPAPAAGPSPTPVTDFPLSFAISMGPLPVAAVELLEGATATGACATVAPSSSLGDASDAADAAVAATTAASEGSDATTVKKAAAVIATRPAGDDDAVATVAPLRKMMPCLSFPYNVTFKCENVVSHTTPGPSDSACYDVVLCLSVTKWVHLNWGDEGIRQLFRKVHEMLAPGGRFLLEPQPWKSYRRKYNVTAHTRKQFHAIKMRPTAFSRHLIDDIGFKSFRLLGKPPGCVPGFRRPLYEYIK